MSEPMRLVDPTDLHRIADTMRFGFAAEARARRRLLVLGLANNSLLIAYAPWWAAAASGVLLVAILITIARDSFVMDRLQANTEPVEE